MTGSVFAAAIVAATAAVDAYMGEAFAVQPMTDAADKTLPPVVDPSRPILAAVAAVYLDPEAKPTMPNSYDPRQVRRPGVESGHPRILLSPSAVAALPAGFRFGRHDRLTRLSTGAVFRVSAVYPMAGGSLRLDVNLIG